MAARSHYPVRDRGRIVVIHDIVATGLQTHARGIPAFTPGYELAHLPPIGGVIATRRA